MFIPHKEYQEILGVLPILCVDCLIVHDNKCLLLKRSKEPAKGQYWFPGGRIFKGEAIRDAALRKAREEVNLECSYVNIISIEETIFPQKENMPTTIHTVNVCCHLSVDNIDELTIDEAHSDHKWVAADQAETLNLNEAVLMPLLKCLD